MPVSRKRKWFKRSAIVIIAFALLVFLLSVALQWVVVQNFTADQLTKYLSRRLQTRVEVDHVQFTVFDKFLLNGFYVEDDAGDTLLYSQQLEIDFESRLWGLFQKRLKIESLKLSNTQLHVRRDTGDYLDNLQVLLNRLKKEEQDTIAKPIDFRFNIKEMELDSVWYSRLDSVNGSSFKAFVKYGRMRVREIDLPQQKFDILLAEFRNSDIAIENFEPHPLPEFVRIIDSFLEEEIPIDTLNPLTVKIDQFRFKNGSFKLDNFRKGIKTSPDNVLDYAHMNLYDIDAEINNFGYDNSEFKGRLDHVDFSELSGFEVYHLAVKDAVINSKKVNLVGLQLQTPYTNLGDTLSFSYDEYADFSDFNDKVKMRLAFDDSKVRMADVMTLVAGLNNDAFFQANKNRDLNISGLISGTINELKGEDLVVQLNGKTRLEGSFRSNDLTEPGFQRINLRLNRLQSDMLTLREILPDFSLPKNFNKLGNVQYSGDLSLIFTDFIFAGNLKTNLGQADLDIKFANINRGFENALYEGKLSLNDFDLEGWTDNSDLGKITMQADVREGRGLTKETVDAVLSATVQNFIYKNYNYENAAFSGRINPRLFTGNLSLKDDNIAFDFSGTLDYTKDIPNFDFNVNMQRLRMKALNLMEKDWAISGYMNIDMDLIDNDLSKSKGRAIVRNLSVSDPIYHQRIDSINVVSRFDTSGRQITLESELLNLELKGHYELLELWNSASNYLHRNFPTYARKLNLPKTEGQVDTNEVNFNLDIHNTGDLTRLLLPTLDTIKGLNFKGLYASDKEKLIGNLQIPRLRYDSITFSDVTLTTDFEGNQGKIDFQVDATELKGGMRFEQVALSAGLDQDTVKYYVYYAPKQEDLEYELNLGGTISPYDSTQFELALNAADLNIFDVKWKISEENYIRFGDGKIRTNKFRLKDSKNRNIQLDAYGTQGINLAMQGFNFSIIDSLWDYKVLNFGGNFDLTARVENIFDLSTIRAEINSDSLMINGDHWGDFHFETSTANTKSTVSNLMTLTKDDSRLTFTAKYNPPSYDKDIAKKSISKRIPNYFDATVTTDRYPLNFLQYFMVGTSNIVGTVDGTLNLNGNPAKPNVSGDLLVNNAGVTIDFLNTRYFVHNQKAKITNRLIDATNAIITDEEGNSARLKGGITHDHLKDLGLNLEMYTNRFVALNTRKEQNETFYGKAIGGGTVNFSGSFTQTNISVQATAEKGTKITIPVTSDRDAPEISFIKFVDKNKKAADTLIRNSAEVTGVDLDLFLTLTDVAEVELVFDERAGDILRGQGRGDIQIYLDRTGEMAMYGNYVIEKGEYLFTLLNFVNKPFVVRRGGTIAWRGDPLNAKIDLKAEYKNLNTSIANLIPEYLVYAPSDAKRRASQPTSIDLIMSLQGELFQPSIEFELAFPQLQGDLRNYADNKLRTLEQDQNELNKQVFGLIVLGQFLPSDFTLNSQSGGDFGINTVSEFVANQLSILVTDIVGEAVGDVKVISGIDVDLDYNRYENQVDVTDDNFYLNGQEYYIRQKTSLWDDKVTVTVGQNVTSTATQGTTKTLFGNDIIVDVVLNEERTLKLKVYYIRQPGIIAGAENQSGIGLSYEREFDSFKDMFRSIFKKDKVEE